MKPGDDLAGDLVAVGLVEDLVPGAGVDPHRDVGEARFAVALAQQVDELTAATADRVVAPRRQQQRQVLADPGEAWGSASLAAWAKSIGMVSGGVSMPHHGSAT